MLQSMQKENPPDPVPVRNDQMARPAYQAIAAVLHIKETKYVIPHAKPVEMQIVLNRGELWIIL